MTTQFTDVFAVPGQSTIIDGINPDTGLSCIYAESLEQVRARYPQAVQMTLNGWLAEQVANQNTPVTFSQTTSEQYHEMLDVLPPAAWIRSAFLVGEPTDRSMETGRPRFQMYQMIGDSYVTSSRPVTVAEFRILAREQR